MKNCEPLLRIAIDGPGGAGKSTIAKLLAARYDIPYVDTGAMYRAVGLKMTRLGLPFEESDELTAMLDSTDIDFVVENVILDGEDVSGLIRTQEISAAASACSKLASVRKKLVALQKEMGKVRSVVMDGRDIGTNVMPDAEFKFYITASARERARRRYLELINKGEQADFDTVLAEINERDYNDMHRELDPLRKADDAIEVDTTHMGIEEVLESVVRLIDN
ncbi:MAG: (d)CMP kinase [Clostridia bacterium]|nr:(d)CMP kinase [Eubacterium sp.]MBR2559709.1 (d)CMP kinase [Bacillota bacterium]MCR4669034.1 (d)CMP kinase [Clostridia bacterium]